jgi:putative ABC transport system permease protein
MLTNYLKIALRNLLRNKVYSFINIFGLTVGLASFLLIALYIFDELTFDRFHKDAVNIYRVFEEKTSAEGKESKVAAVAYNISTSAKTDFPEINRVARISGIGRANILNDENTKSFYEFYWVASDEFLQLFDFKILSGDRNTALQNPNSVVVTAETAKKIFGTTDVVGKTLRADRDSLPFKITAVIEDFPANSHLNFNLAFSESTILGNENFKDFMLNDWSSNTFVSYFQLKNKASVQTAEKIKKLVESKRKDEAKLVKSNFVLQPLKDIHFYSTGIESDFNQGNIFHIYVFGIVALFVLLIACINYMNLATARFANRAKEIGVRKVAGAGQKSLVTQFLSEALLTTIIALILSLLVVKLLLPAFNQFAEKKLTLGLTTDYRIWLGIFFIVLFVGFVSGIYPALFQSRLTPNLLLKSKIEQSKSVFSIRRMLVVFQFSLSIIMIVATLIVYMQLKYVNKKDMGFNKEQLVVVDINSGGVRRSAETIKTEFAKLTGVKNVSVTSRVPGEWKIIPKVKVKSGSTSSAIGNDMYFMAADDQFLKTFEIGLVQGRNFSGANLGDSSTVLINEAAAKLLGIKEPTEQIIQIPSIDFSGNVSLLSQPFSARVIGIVKDFNFRSLRETVAPMVLAYQKNPVHNIDYFTSRILTNNTSETLSQMEAILHKIDQEHLFEYNFLDKQWDLFYREDQKRQTIFIGIALMTILIACLGLFGLATYAAEQRKKEIGIRKVLGATVTSIVNMLSKDFLKLVLIAAIIAFPVAWLAMNSWLNDFAYRINLGWWVFVLAGILALVIAFITVSFQAVKAANANPVKNLRTE